ncbi:50S ribosomal protein L14e [Candidatus Micrarchaeota archaeon RBG_16_36_9]|nr:MAG: 50S ribosomal protein L14e [Candidatus Micrarchaeota archaeon RBG_16_36_9]
MLEPGRVVLKIAGREAGKYAVIVDTVKDNFVLITGPKSITGVKRRKCNIDHIEPTEHKFDVKQDVDDSSLENIWKSSGLIEKLEIKVPIKREFKKKEPVEKKKK